MTKIAYLGCAHIHTPNFIERTLKHPGIATKFTWDEDRTRGEEAAEKLGAALAAYPEEIVADPEVAAVVVCSETRTHEALAGAAIRAGKHVFVEKPLGFAADDARRIADLVQEYGVIFQTGYFMRSAAIHRFLKMQVAEGSFGKITRIQFANAHCAAVQGWFDTDWRWMASPAEAGCGALGDMGTHSLDLMMWMFGSVRRVCAVAGNATGRYEGCDDHGLALLQFHNGLVGTLAGSWAEYKNCISLEIHGTEGTAYVCNGELFFRSSRIPGADGATPWTDLPGALPHAFDMFLTAVAGGSTEDLVTAEEAAGRSVVTEAMYRSAAQAAWVDV